MTRGAKTSERKACYHAFFAGFIISLYGIHEGSDLSGLAFLIVSVGGPLMWYAGNRTALKAFKTGEADAGNSAP